MSTDDANCVCSFSVCNFSLPFWLGFGRLGPPKFRLLTEVNPDGIRFPGTPEAFREEVFRQAQELHCGHAGLRIDLSRL